MTKREKRIIEGAVLRPSAAVKAQMAKAMLKLIKAMQAEVMAEVRAVFHVEQLPVIAEDVAMRQARELGLVPPVVTTAMDANLSELAASVITKLTAKWQDIFDKGALAIADRMVSSTLKRSDATAGPSLKDVGKDLTIAISPAMRVYIDAAAQESVALIKRVPAQYLPNVQQDVMRSITTGEGLKDLVPALKARNVKVRNWAENVARDQTRKAYATVNRVRMREAGIRKFKWVHSGGSNAPREHHLLPFPQGLNGGIFSLDEPPIIDEKTGERGFPGQLPYCGCTMSPVIEVEESDYD